MTSAAGMSRDAFEDGLKMAIMIAAIDDVRTHVYAWTRLLERYLEIVKSDPDSDDIHRSCVEYELHAMRRDLAALVASVPK
jgi:hypothetical protein